MENVMSEADVKTSLKGITVNVSVSHNYITFATSSTVMVPLSVPTKLEAVIRQVVTLELNTELFYEHMMAGNLTEDETKDTLSNLKDMYIDLQKDELADLSKLTDDKELTDNLMEHYKVGKHQLSKAHAVVKDLDKEDSATTGA